MKKLLLGTTALLSAALFADLAQAADAPKKANEPIKITLGGYFRAAYVVGDQDDGRVANSAGTLSNQPGFNRRDSMLFREAEIHFRGETKLDNGLTVGVRVELEAESCSDQVDENYVYFTGGFGTVWLGGDDSVASKFNPGIPYGNVLWGGYSANYDLTGNQGANRYALADTEVTLEGDAEKISYWTPRIYGFRAAMGYTPDGCEQNTIGGCFTTGAFNLSTGVVRDATGAFTADGNDIEDIWSFAADFDYTWESLSKLRTQGYIAYSEATAKGFGSDFRNSGVVVAQATGQQGGDGNLGNDPTDWGTGVVLSLMGFSLGGQYEQSNNVGTRGGLREDAWSVGASYTFGPWTVGTSYVTAETEYSSLASLAVAGATNALQAESLDQWEIGARYVLGPGITVFGGVTLAEWDAEGFATAAQNSAALITRRNEAWLANLGTEITF